jgi:hypothetical protein
MRDNRGRYLQGRAVTPMADLKAVLSNTGLDVIVECRKKPGHPYLV